MKFLPVVLLLGILTTCSATPGTSDSSNSTISSGRVNTLGKFSFMYGSIGGSTGGSTGGSIEASIKMPSTANGLWPAFWLLGEDYETTGWPGCGEIDIVEMGARKGIDNNTQDRFLTGGCHWGEIINDGSSVDGNPTDGTHPNYYKEYTDDKSLPDGFHTYRMDWNSQKISMYLDGDKQHPYFEMAIDDENGVYPVIDYFNKPFCILFNLAVGGDYPEIYQNNEITALNKNNGFTASMYVDYVQIMNESGDVIWKDNFDGPELDSKIWNIEVNDLGGGNHELQSYRRENVSIGKEPETGKSCLILTAKEK